MRIIFFVLFLYFSTFITRSQSLGIEAGLRFNMSSINYSGVDINKKLGIEAGVFYKHPILEDKLSLRAGLTYFNNAFSMRSAETNTIGITYHFREDNLKIPVSVEWYPISGSIKPFLQLGLYTSCSFSGKIKAVDSSTSLKYASGGNRFDYGAIVGMGAYLTSNIAVSARYEHAFRKRELKLGDQFVPVENRGCVLSLNYLF